MTDLHRIALQITPGDLAGAGCLVIIAIWGWPAVAVLAAILEHSP